MTTELVTTDNRLMSISDSPLEMAAKLADMKAMLDLTQRFFKDVMIPNQDYGTIPGTEKPTLLKAGAEKLTEFYGYAPIMKEVIEEKSIDTGFYRARVIVALAHKRTGAVVAEGVGEANTYEGRYRWRWVTEKKLPPGINKDNLECREKDGKYGFYKEYRMENEDPWTLWNTVLKMAKKRGLIDATLSATRSSGIFTQDVEDLQEWASQEEGGDKQQSGRKNANSSSQTTGQFFCTDCGIQITEAVDTYSKRKFNKPLCQPCQKKASATTTEP